MANPRQPRRPITRRLPTALAATRGALAFSDPVIAVNPYQTGANIYPTASAPNAQGFRSPNPPVDQISATKPPLQNYGATGTSFFGGIIQSDEYNPEFGWRDAVIKFEQMSRNEAQIFAIKQLVEQPILAAKWSIEPASDAPIDKEIASFVQSCLFDDMCYTSESSGTEVYQSWSETLRQILMYKWYGFMLLEKCFRIEDGWVKWSRFLPLLPRTVWRWYVGEDNELESVEQWAYKAWTYQYNRIPRGKLIHFANRMEGQNYQGISVLRSAFKNWWYKQQFEKIAAIELERNAIIPPVITMGPNPSADEVGAALKLAQNIRANEQLGVVIGHDMKFEYPRMMERGSAQVMPLIEYHDIMMARNVLGQFINLGSHEVGSYALGQQQATMFLSALQSDCQYICDIINHQAIRQLVDYNYDGVAVYPKLTCSRLVAQDISTLSNALQFLNTYVPPSPEVNDAIADVLGLPKPPASLVESTNPTNPTTPERPDNERAGDHTTDDGHMAQGHVSGSGGGRDQSGDYQDTYDNGGAGDGVGMSERADAARREFRLLRESLDAFHAQLDGEDAVERGVSYLFAGGGNPNHIPKGEPGAGQFAPGGSGGHGGSGEHEGSGRGRGSRGGGSGGSEHEGHSRSSGGGRSSSRGEHAPKAPKASRSSKAKDEHEDIHQKSARLQKEHGLKAEVHSSKGKELEVVKKTGWKPIDPFHAPSPHDLVTTYGEHQLGAALHQFSHESLREMARNEGIKAGRTRDETISRITSHVTQGRYSANFGTHAAKGEHEATTHTTTHATKSSRSSKGETEKSAKAPRAKKAPKTEEEKHAEKLTKARAKVADAEREVRAKDAEAEAIRVRNGDVLPPAGHSLQARHALGRAQEAQARLEGRQLHPAEKGLTREEFLQGKGTYMKGFTTVHVSPAEAKAYLEHPTLRDEKSAKATTASRTPRAKKEPEQVKQLVPIRPQEPGSIHISNARTPNPYGLAHIYGMHQLRQALEGYSLEKLRDSAALVQQHYPGTKPTRMGSKKAVIDYIHEYVGRNPDAGDKSL